MRILLLHGWLLERSGSNVYNASLARAWVRAGHEVHLFCQERHPEHLDFVSEARFYGQGEEPRVTYSADVPGPGRCVLHRPDIGDLLPVFNLDEYESFRVVKRFVDLEPDELERYLALNAAALERVTADFPVDVGLANHVFPNPTIMQRLKARTGLPFAVFPHGSAIEYAVKRSARLKDMAREAIDASDALIVGNHVVTERIWRLYPERQADWSRKHAIVPVGVDIRLFEPVVRAERPASVRRLLDLGNPGDGKGRADTAWLLDRARGVGDDDGLLALVREARGKYKYTSPDRDLADSLAGVDWTRERIVLYVGKLIAGKGVHHLLLALPEVLRAVPDARVLLVGESTYRETLEILLMALSEGRGDLLERILRMGWELDERPREPLERAIRYVERVGSEQLLAWGQENRPVDRVIFTGYLNHARFRHLLPCADVAVFPSEIAEAYPLVLLESICAGVLPMAAYFEGLRDGLDEISEGLPPALQEGLRIHVEPDRKVAEIAEKLPRLLTSTQDWSGYCRDLAVSRYSWESVARRMAECLEPLRVEAARPAP